MLQLPLFPPQSSWRPPISLPELDSEPRIALDLETNDPGLKSRGPGYHRREGFPVGISLAIPGRKWYLPFAHLEGGNLDQGLIVRYLTDLMKKEREWVFANATYDLGWLHFLGLRPKGKIRCIQITEALLDEEREDGYSLNVLAKDYLGKTKNEELLREAALQYGLDPKADMWKMHSKFVGPYAEDDASETLEIFEKQLLKIQEEDLTKTFELESDLILMTHDIGARGIRVDLERAIRMNEQWKKDIEEMGQDLRAHGIDIWSSQSLAEYCDRKGLPYDKTKTGQPSFTKDNLPYYTDPIMKRVAVVRNLDRNRSKFLEKDLILGSINGRIHPNFVQLHNDEGGTRSGRYACKNPNVQQAPKRSKIECDADTFSLIDVRKPLRIGKAIRGNLIPESGKKWLKFDYDSQEPRMQVHYALLKKFPGAEEAKEIFNQGRKLYDFIQQACGLSYDDAKAGHLGRSYEMGLKSFAEFAKIDEDEAADILNKLDEACPFIRLLQGSVKAAIDRRGFVRCIGGRKQRFDWWQPDDRSKKLPVKGLEAAKKKWPNTRLHRAYKYKGLNRLIQGSCADQSKQGYLDAYKAGHLCILPLHDEGNWSDIETEKQAYEIKEIMENAIELALPTRCDMDLAERWL